jgi:hypothetical protein
MDTGAVPERGAGAPAVLQGGAALPKAWSGLSETSGEKGSSEGSSRISKGNDLPAAITGYTELGHNNNKEDAVTCFGTPRHGDKSSTPKENSHRLSGDMVFAAPEGPAGVPIFGPASVKEVQVVAIKASDPASLYVDDDGEPENTWMDPTKGDHGGLYVKALRRYIFPFMVKYSAWIVFAWVVIFAISCAFGLKFLDNTRSNLDLPREKLMPHWFDCIFTARAMLAMFSTRQCPASLHTDDDQVCLFFSMYLSLMPRLLVFTCAWKRAWLCLYAPAAMLVYVYHVLHTCTHEHSLSLR